MTNDKINYGILALPASLIGILRQIGRVATEGVINLPAVVVSGRHLAV